MPSIVRSVRRSRRARGKVEIVLDDGQVIRVDPILAAGVPSGRALDASEVEALRREDQVETGLRRAIARIARRPRSEHEMRLELARRGLAAGQQQEILRRLAERGLLDDGAFAATWVENRKAFRPRSAAGLRFELRRKGVAPQAIDDALRGYDEEAAASAALQRMARRWKDLPAEDFRRRAQDYLVRRGFTVAAARQAARADAPGAEPAQSEETS